MVPFLFIGQAESILLLIGQGLVASFLIGEATPDLVFIGQSLIWIRGLKRDVVRLFERSCDLETKIK
jgi:hypothetical protein